MQVLYCDVCGVKLPELDMPGTVDAALCEKCAAARGVASSTPPQVLAEASDRRKSSSIRLKAISPQGAGTDIPGAGYSGVGTTVSVAETPRRKSSTRLRAITPDGTARKTPIGGSSTAFAVPAKPPAPSPAIQEGSAPAGNMGFYFCEKCGKRVTAADLARGQGRDKQLKGVHCAACSEGTMTVAFDAVSQAEVWKEEQARRQVPRRSTSTRLPVAKAEGAAPRRGRARMAAFRSYKSSSGAAWVILAVILLGGIGALFAVGIGSRPPAPVASSPSPLPASGQADGSSAQAPLPKAVTQVSGLPQTVVQDPTPIPVAQAPEPTEPVTQEPASVPVAQAPEPTEPVTQEPASVPVAQAPEPTEPVTQEPTPVPAAQMPEPTTTVSVAEPKPEIHTVGEPMPTAGVELAAEADAFVRAKPFTGRNFGTVATLETKEDGFSRYVRRAYVRFDLSTLPAAVTSAKLRLYASAVGSDAGTRSVKFVVDDTWQETAINWGNAPAPSGAALATWQPVAGQSAELDLTATVQQELAGDKKLSLLIYATGATGGSGQADFASREAGTDAQRPVLIITP